MSTSKGSGGGVQPIPASARKMVQSLKEVVNLPDAEIYATLKDCNMDPDEAVNRLLSQDPFHEVKSKREKKKEGKDTNETRPRGANNTTGRGGKSSGADSYPSRGGSTPYYSSDSAPTYGKSPYKKENGAAPYTSSLPLAPGLSGNNRSRGTAVLSDDSSAENKGPSWGTSWGTTDGMPLVAQPTSTSHSVWAGTPGQVSMADIVKMGRPHNKAVNAPNGSHYNVQDPSTTLHDKARSFDDHASKDEWPSIEKPVASIVKPIPESTVDSHVHPEESSVPFDCENQDSESEEDEEIVDYDVETSALNDSESRSLSGRKFPDDDARGGPLFENEVHENMGSYVPQAHDFEHHEVEEGAASVSSLTRHLEQLSVEQDDKELSSEADAPSVIIPDHLQVQSTDCSHLSFGSFGSGMRNPHPSGAATSLPTESKLEEQQAEVGVSSVGADPRDSEYYGDDSFRNAPESSLYQRTGPSSDRYDARTGPSSDRYETSSATHLQFKLEAGAVNYPFPSSATQHERLKPETAEVNYPFPSSNPDYSFAKEQLLNAAFSQANTEMQNQSPFTNVTQSYPSSLSSTLLAANVRPSREPEQYSPFSLTSAMSTKYASANSGAGNFMSEALASMSKLQSAPHNLSGTNVVSGGQPLPQQLAVHPYSQPPLPLGPYASMVGYPFLHQQGYYMPSAFQQTLANNSPYNQSLPALPTQYKNSASASSVHQSAAIASGYGGLGNTGSISGNFPMNQPAAPALSGASLNYDDALSQYKDVSRLISLQQSENSSMWPPQGLNSRTAVPSGTYFNHQSQAQQPNVFRQSRQVSPNYGALGYPNFYHSQAGMAQGQPQNPRSGSQGQSRQSQNWQNNLY